MDIEEKMENASSIKKVFIVIFFAGLMVVLVGVAMMIWNAILPEVIGVTEVNYWQMLGILFLSKLLFGGNKFGSKNNKHKHKKSREWREKFKNMTDEEKETFKSEWRSRWDKC
jgi:Ca2+/H+ antiporter, TMEM165/GDT1 family